MNVLIGSIISRDPGLVTREFPCLDKLVERSDFEVDPDNEVAKLN